MFNGREVYTITTNNDIKMGLVINEIKDTLDGFLVYDENNNMSYQYSFTLGKQNYQTPSPIIELSGKFGEKEELYIDAEKGYVSIDYNVYDEEGNYLYTICADALESIKYGEAKELTITSAGNWYLDSLNEKEKIAVHAYYEESRTLTFTFNKDNTFTVEILSTDEMITWYENNVGLLINGCFGEKEELILSTIEVEGNVSITYRIYDAEGNCLYLVNASAELNLEYGKKIELTITDAFSYDANYFNEERYIAICAYYEEVS